MALSFQQTRPVRPFLKWESVEAEDLISRVGRSAASICSTIKGTLLSLSDSAIVKEQFKCHVNRHLIGLQKALKARPDCEQK